MAIKILVDSASDIDATTAQTMGITMVPMEINFGNEQYWDGVTLNSNEFFTKLVETGEFPKTSQINSARFTEQFAALTKDGSQVLCILMSSKLSGTFHSAQQAAKEFGEQVAVVDSLNVCIGERILIEYARQLVAQGQPLAEIVAELNRRKTNIKLVALLNTLQYLQKGGRISRLTALVGSMVKLKPVIAIVNGEVRLVGKALGSKNGNNRLTQLIQQSHGIDFGLPYAAAYSGLDASLLHKYLQDSTILWQAHTPAIPVYQIGSTIGTHAGPGAIAVAFFGGEHD